ncbi:hypothetical protein N5J54_13345 [Acinetobacter ursingii]|uniref:hypothetical protein n=1 Tax=Acinetobacter ursingii TaxID=108980 RepID=UPI00244A2EA2|nr:hypothetical protein [Acinetobacter ursingii]MDH2104701.1 hypothetical protein [Acinetobacter ursingii]
MSDNQMTAEQAKKNLKDAEGKPQKGEGGTKGGIPPKLLIVIGVIALIMIGTFFWIQMSKPKDVSTAVAPEQTPESIDTVGQGIQQTQATYIQNQQPLKDNSIADDTAFIVDENIVFKDPTTGQYMIMYKSMSYPIDSDLGKEAISFYQSQGTNALVLLHRLQEKEQAQGQIQNGEQTAVAQSETKIKNEQLKAENDDLKNLVELQEQAIKELKTSLITIAKDQTKQKALSTSGSKTLSIPKGAKRLDAFAVVGDRAWMTDSQNHTYTVYVGQKMPDNRRVYAADENEQAIWVK